MENREIAPNCLQNPPNNPDGEGTGTRISSARNCFMDEPRVIGNSVFISRSLVKINPVPAICEDSDHRRHRGFELLSFLCSTKLSSDSECKRIQTFDTSGGACCLAVRADGLTSCSWRPLANVVSHDG